MDKPEYRFRAWHRGYPADYRKGMESQMLQETYPGEVFAWLHNGQPLEIMQFTGYHDKNEQEAYRDDIIETPYYIMGRESGSMRRGVIEFKDGCFGVQDGHEFVPLCNLRVPTKTEYIPNYGEKAVEFEIPWVIIGNIYENPDLLEVPHK